MPVRRAVQPRTELPAEAVGQGEKRSKTAFFTGLRATGLLTLRTCPALAACSSIGQIHAWRCILWPVPTGCRRDLAVRRMAYRSEGQGGDYRAYRLPRLRTFPPRLPLPHRAAHYGALYIPYRRAGAPIPSRRLAKRDWRLASGLRFPSGVLVTYCSWRCGGACGRAWAPSPAFKARFRLQRQRRRGHCGGRHSPSSTREGWRRRRLFADRLVWRILAYGASAQNAVCAHCHLYMGDDFV